MKDETTLRADGAAQAEPGGILPEPESDADRAPKRRVRKRPAKKPGRTA